MEITNNKNFILHSDTKHNGKNDITTSPSFRAVGVSPVLNGSGAIMQSIENGGFLVSFIIQDFLGMTVPRSVAGFLRDKDETGEYNIQEGFEVMGREGLTGPCMMSVAPLSLLIAAKFGHSNSVNTQLIKCFGDKLTEMVSEKGFDENLLKDAAKFKEQFYRKNIKNILIDTLGESNIKEDSVDYIMQELKKRENVPAGMKLSRFRGKAKFKAECMNNIVNHINNIRYENSSELDLLGKVKIGTKEASKKKVFDAKKVFEALEKYSHDAITANNKLEQLNKLMSEKIKNTALGKRIITNIAMIAATLGVLSVLPKIYARSNTAPGARKNNKNKQTIKNSDIAFKGKGNLPEYIGKAVNKNKSDFVANELEYNGHNFTNTLMAGLSIFGLLIPRGLRAYNRAQKDENGKRDLTELWEILVRDVTSSLAVIFAVPMITRACVTSYEKYSGFVLMQKDRTKSKINTILDLLNPYSKAHVLSNSELTNLYGNIDSKEKMVNFCKYIDKNGGDLQKIISKSENLSTVFNESTLDLNKLKGKSKSAKNSEIISFFENIESKFVNKDKKSINEIIAKLMKQSSGKKSKIVSFARGMNSLPALLTTLVISPYILGWFIPRLTYKNTRRIHAKEDREAEKLKTNA